MSGAEVAERGEGDTIRDPHLDTTLTTDTTLLTTDTTLLPTDTTLLPTADKFFCVVCLEEHNVFGEGVQLVGGCEHIVCRESLLIAAANFVRNSKSRIPSCFICREPAPIAVLLAVTPTPDLLLRATVLAADKKSVACPVCETGWAVGGSAATPALVCNECAHAFCFHHGDAHAPAAAGSDECIAFEAAHMVDMPTAGTIAKTTVECPGCGVRIERAIGCSHMNCTACATHFCYECGRLRSSCKCRHVLPPAVGVSGGVGRVERELNIGFWPGAVHAESIVRVRIGTAVSRALADLPGGALALDWRDGASVVVELNLLGAPETPFEGATFRVDLIIPFRYPFARPKVRFVDQVPWHPNISSDGLIDWSEQEWSPALTLTLVMIDLQALLSMPDLACGVRNPVAAAQFERGEWASQLGYISRIPCQVCIAAAANQPDTAPPERSTFKSPTPQFHAPYCPRANTPVKRANTTPTALGGGVVGGRRELLPQLAVSDFANHRVLLRQSQAFTGASLPRNITVTPPVQGANTIAVTLPVQGANTIAVTPPVQGANTIAVTPQVQGANTIAVTGHTTESTDIQ